MSVFISMKFLHSYILSAAVIISMAASITSCGSDSPDRGQDGGKKSLKRCILLYAVASNNLYSNLVSDKEEILEAAAKIDMDGLEMLVYQVTFTKDDKGRLHHETSLLRLVKGKDGACEFIKIRDYDSSLYSTDPRRITEVMTEVRRLKDADKYGLILWSHGTGIDPAFSTHTPPWGTKSGTGDYVRETFNSQDKGAFFSFGSDNDPGKDKKDEDDKIIEKYYDKIDIDELAEAIPSGMFDFIWFDACYMGGIETAYELKGKCEKLVAYPTEVYTPGMPYDKTMPYLLREKPLLEDAARIFFDYYDQHPSSTYHAATVAVLDMNHIDEVAEVSSRIYGGKTLKSAVGLQKYSRSSHGPFYDFGQYVRECADQNDMQQLKSDFESAMNRFVVYKAATPRDFNGNVIASDNFSGLSCFHYSPESSTDKAKYYRSLKWYDMIYPDDK